MSRAGLFCWYGKAAKFLGYQTVVRIWTALLKEDDKFIECAFAAGADYIVSGDKHLLKVACYKKTQIASVNEFLQIIETKR